MASRGLLDRLTRAGLAALAEALFPANEVGAPDWRDADVVARTLVYMDELPRPQRRLLTFLFCFVELASPLLVPCFSRFSKLVVDRRTAAIRRWRKSRFILFRYLGDGIKATMTMMYMSHPDVMAYVGAFKPCANPEDPLTFEIRERHFDELEARA